MRDISIYTKQFLGLFVLPLVLISCSESNPKNGSASAAVRLGTFPYAYTISSSSETIAVNGDPAAQSNAVFSRFINTSLNNNGDLAFLAFSRDGVAQVENRGLWLRLSNGNLSPLAWQGAMVNNNPDLLFDSIEDRYHINDAAQVLFASSLSGTAVVPWSNSALYFRDQDGSTIQLARTGDVVADWPSNPTIEYFSSVRDLNQLGEVVYIAWVNLGADSTQDGDLIAPGVWLKRANGMPNLALNYGSVDPANGWMFQTFIDASINNQSNAIVVAQAGPTWRHGVWLIDANDALSNIAVEGTSAPNMVDAMLGNPTTYAYPTMAASQNDNGDIALFSLISGAGVDYSNDHAIWLRDSNANYQLVVREGDLLPSINTDATVAAINASDLLATKGKPLINNNGQVLYSTQLAGSTITGNNDKALWLWDRTSNNHKVVQTGDSVSGLANGEFVASFPMFGDGMQLNDNGEVLLNVTLAGAGVDASNDQAILYYNVVSGANIFLREGDNMNIAAGDSRIVSNYLSEGNPGINNASQVAFVAEFINGSGVFLTTPKVAVPVPTPAPNSGCVEHEDEDDDDDHHADDDMVDHGVDLKSVTPFSVSDDVERETHHEQEECEIEYDDDDHDSHDKESEIEASSHS